MFHKLIIASASLFPFLLPCSGALGEDAAAAPNATVSNVAPQIAAPKKTAVKPNKVVKRKIYQMVFSSNRDAPSNEQSIYSMNFDGSDVRRLTNPETDEYPGLDDRCPAVSPDGSRIVFSRFSGDQNGYDLFLLDTKTSKLTQITHDVGSEYHPSWSPDGKNIAFSGRPRLNAAADGIMDDTWSCIHILNLDTGKRWQMTAPKNDAYQPAWSFDGDKIAFVGVQNVEDDPLVLGTLRRMDGTEKERYGSLQGIPTIALARGSITPVEAIYIAYLDSSGTSVKSFEFINESNVTHYSRDANGMSPPPGRSDGLGHYVREVNGRFFTPAWSLDNSTLFYLTNKNNNLGNPNLYAQNLQTRAIRDIAPNTPWEADPVMVSNGTSSKLVYVRSNKGNHDLLVGDLGDVAFNLQQLTSSPFLGHGQHLVSMEPSCYPLIRQEIVKAETTSQ